MLDYKCLHGTDLNENSNFRNGKLIIHGYMILQAAILTEAARARPLSSQRKWGGGRFGENADFQRRTLSLVYHFT